MSDWHSTEAGLILHRVNTSGINTEIKVNGQSLGTVTSFKYLGSVITDKGSKPEISVQDSTGNNSFDKAETNLD